MSKTRLTKGYFKNWINIDGISVTPLEGLEVKLVYLYIT